MPRNERPFIVRFENQKSVWEFDVVIQHEDASQATAWVNNYFGLMRVEYLHSDFNHQHTYHICPKSK